MSSDCFVYPCAGICPCGFEKEMGAVAKKSDPPWVLRYWWLCGCAIALLWLLSRIVE